MRPRPEEETTSAGESGEPILIETLVVLPPGEVLPGSLATRPSRREIPWVGAVEVNQGSFAENGVKVGDQVRLQE